MNNQKLTEYGAIPRVEVIDLGEEVDGEEVNASPIRQRKERTLFLLASASLLLIVALVAHPTASSSAQHFRIDEADVIGIRNNVKPLNCPG